MSERNIVMVKFGGSVITDKSKEFTPKTRAIQRLAREIHSFDCREKVRLIVAHGGGSFPHVYAKKYRVSEGGYGEVASAGISRVQDSAATLNRLVVRCLLKVGEKPLSIQPSACALAENSHIAEWNTTIIKRALDMGLTPVPYGDVAFDREKGCSILSTEEILRYLCTKLPTRKVVVGIKEDGVFDENGVLVPEINKSNLNTVLRWTRGSPGIDVTGGMRSKVLTLFRLVESSAATECVIINISEPGNLKKCLEEEDVVGTKITV